MEIHFFLHLCSVGVPSSFALVENLLTECAYEKQYFFPKLV